MMAFLRILLIAAFAVLIAAACGGGDDEGSGSELEGEELEVREVTVEEYFAEFERLAMRLDERRTDLADDYNFPEATDEVRLQRGEDFFGDALSAIRAYNSGLTSMDPPGSLQSLHDQITSTGADLVQRLAEAEQQADSASDVGEVDALYDDIFGEGGPWPTLAGLCVEAEAAASGEGIAVDLLCEV